MRPEHRSWLLAQQQRWHKMLQLAYRKPWLATYLLRQIKQCREKMWEQLQQLWLLLSFTRRRRAKKWLRQKVGPALVGGGLILALNFGVVQAGTITVSHTNDNIINDSGCSLREAIINANNDDQSGSTDCAPGNGADIITLPSGTISLTLTGIDEDLAATGDLDIISGSQITLNGQGMDQSIVDGNLSDRVLHVQPGASLTLSDLTVKRGDVDSGSGAGILNHNGNLTLVNTRVTSNTLPEGEGGPPGMIIAPEGAAVDGSAAKLLSADEAPGWHGQSRFELNKDRPQSAERTRRPDSSSNNLLIQSMPPLEGRGGGISNQGVGGVASFMMTNSIVISNTGGQYGGGVSNVGESGSVTVQISGSTITGNVSIMGAGLANETYSGGTVTANITNSSIISGNIAACCGGGIINYAYDTGTNTVTIENSTISGNGAFNGGGIHNLGYNGTSNMSVTNSTISGNSAYNGGGISNYGVDYGLAKLTVTNSTISGNRGAGIGGGVSDQAIFYGSTNVTLDNNSINGNEADVGGGVGSISFLTGSAVLTMTKNTINNNTAAFVGGGIANFAYVYAEQSMTLRNSTISGNQANNGGGGIANYAAFGSTHSFEMVQSTVSGNSTGGPGAGIDNYSTDGGRIIGSINNSTISGNRAAGHGGGIGSFATAGGANPLTVVQSTVTNNTADNDNDSDGEGGGIYASGALTVSNTIVAGNFDTPNNAGSGTIHPDAHNQVNGNAHNLVSNTSGVTGTLGSGSDIAASDPGLAGLANNGGTATASGLPPFTHLLLDNSPARDAADVTICAAAPINGVDQRDLARGSSRCDIGAIEFYASLYLPVVVKDYAAGPDLVIDSIIVDGSGPTVTVRNAGTTSSLDPFWVDLYVNPGSTPKLNQEWHEIASSGVAWGVTQALAPGQTVVLTLSSPYYEAAESNPIFPANATIYAFADSIHDATSNGNVIELDETNNLGGPVTVSAIAANEVAPLIETAAETPPPQGLPQREAK